MNRHKIELFVKDVRDAIAFYQHLGFEVVHIKDDGYTTMANSSLVLALCPLAPWQIISWLRLLRYPPLGTELVLYGTQLEALRERLIKAGYKPGKIKLQKWGDMDFRITDPDGYYVRLSEGAAIPR